MHEEGNISFWNEESLTLSYSITLNKPSKKIVFEESFRYLASLSTNGSVEVWKVKGTHETHWWDLSYTSISDISNIENKENQFSIVMNSEDKKVDGQNAILLFQYSRP